MHPSRIAEIRLRIVCAVVLGSLLCTGCSSDDPSGSYAAPASSNSTVPASTADDRASENQEVTLRLGSWDDVQRFIASQAGKVVVVNVWSTTCGACAEEFPRFVELHRKFEQKDVVCVSFDCDYDGIRDKPPEYYRERVLTFLTNRKATTENFLSTVAFIDLIEPPASLMFPLALVYGRDGRLLKRFDNENLTAGQKPFTYSDVDRFVAALLDER